MTEIILQKSSNKDKKYDAFVDGKKVSFGQRGASDFTQHRDVERKQRYLDRHRKNENWNDLKTAGAWSRWLTWNKPTISASIADMEKRFKVDIKRK